LAFLEYTGDPDSSDLDDQEEEEEEEGGEANLSPDP